MVHIYFIGTNPVKLFCESPFECSTPESESPTYMYTAVPVSPLSETPRTSHSSNGMLILFWFCVWQTIYK